jgi:hypothetical protein
LDSIKHNRRSDRWTTILTGDDGLDAPLDVILGLVDELQRGWTPAQWEAVGWTMRGLKRQETARRLKVAHQNVSKRLAAAGWPAVSEALAFIRGRLAAHPAKGAKRQAP